jgi:hypothetical protein
MSEQFGKGDAAVLQSAEEWLEEEAAVDERAPTPDDGGPSRAGIMRAIAAEIRELRRERTRWADECTRRAGAPTATMYHLTPGKPAVVEQFPLAAAGAAPADGPTTECVISTIGVHRYGPSGKCVWCGGAAPADGPTCPHCGSNKVAPTKGNAVGNTMDCLSCLADFTPGAAPASPAGPPPSREDYALRSEIRPASPAPASPAVREAADWRNLAGWLRWPPRASPRGRPSDRGQGRPGDSRP